MKKKVLAAIMATAMLALTACGGAAPAAPAADAGSGSGSDAGAAASGSGKNPACNII